MSVVSISAAPMESRSLWVDARIRLMRNRAAVVSIWVLLAIALASVFGPAFTGHAYDKVYQDYVRVPASLSAYPKAESIPDALSRIAARARTQATDIVVTDGMSRATLTSSRTIDERLLVYFDRSDLFGAPRILERSDEGKKLTIEVPIKQTRFLFGTDSNGRDLLRSEERRVGKEC